MALLYTKKIITLLRPHQWLKNLFVFLPVFFDKHLTEYEYIIPAIVTFCSFCLAASGIYCFNDIYDAEVDKLHHKKRHRPIASGFISQKVGIFISLLCVVSSYSLLYFLTQNYIELSSIITIYVLMNILYCVKLKNFALVDVFIIAIGFVLRILIGGISTGIWLSQWIVLMTFLLALFLAFAKRRDDVVIYEGQGVKLRKNINRYNLQFMNQAITIVATITMVCYIMYTVSEEVIQRFNTHYLYMTSIFVLAGIIRYLQITIVDTKSGSPTSILIKDRFIHACIFSWIIVFLIIIYF